MNLRQEAAKGVAWSAVQSWGARAASFLIMLVLARLVAPEAFGLVALASVFVAFAQVFLDQGFGDAIVQCPKLERAHLDTAFWTGLLVGGLLTVGGVAASGLIAAFFDEPQLAPVLGWLSLSSLFGALSSVQQAILRRQLAFRSLAARSLVATMAGGIVAIGAAFLGLGVWSLVAKLLVTGLVGTAVLWRVSNWRPGFSISRPHFKELFAFGINLVGSNFVDFFGRRSDNLLIGYFLGPIALGYYTLAYNLLVVMTEVLTSVPNAVAFPVFSRLHREPARLRRSFYQVTQLMSVVAFPLFLGMALLAPEAVLALYGPEWVPSVPVVRILMFIGILHSVFYLYGNLIKAVGRPSWRFAILSLIAICNVVGFALVVRRGIASVAMAYVVVGYMALPLYFLAVRALIGVDLATYLRQYVPTLASSLVMVVTVLGLKTILHGKSVSYVQLFILVPVGGLTYIVALHFSASALSREMLELARLALPAWRQGKHGEGQTTDFPV